MFQLKIETDGAAFHPADSTDPVPEATELTSLLLQISMALMDGTTEGKVMDGNGNSVGIFQLKRD